MKNLKKFALTIISLAVIMCVSVSCFGIFFVPVVSPVSGLPGYTLNQEYVTSTEAYLETAKKYTIEGKSNTDVNTAWSNFVYAYYEVASQTNVAYVLYASDASSETYKNNYLFASESYNAIYAKYMKALQEIYSHEQSNGVTKDQSFFSNWSEEDLNRILKYTDKVAQLENEVDELQVEYAELQEEDFNEQSVVIYKQIVDKNKQIATEYGFENYYAYASDYVYDRDYTASQVVSFRENVAKYLPSIITELKSNLDSAKEKLTDGERTLLSDLVSAPYNKTSTNYWEKYVASYEGQNAKDDFNHAFENSNVMFADGAYSREMAFNAYMPAYSKSFCYFGPGYQDAFTVAHEIGHYYAGLNLEYGSASMDLNETHSQGNEMLLLEFLSSELNANSFKALELSKISSILSTVLVSTIIDDFEYFVYTNDVTNYTAQDFDDKMNEICQKYGGRTFVDTVITDINRYWRLVVAEQPLYYVSYATSGVSAVNLYFKADESRAEARQAYSKLVEQHQSQLGFAGNLTSAGLVSPFDSKAFENVYLFVYGTEYVEPENSESTEQSSEELLLAA